MNENLAAFAKLIEYEKRSVSFSPGSSRDSGPAKEWSGVTFALGESRLTCKIDQIHEILPIPVSTPVPGAKPWIIGLANVRGSLLTAAERRARHRKGARRLPQGREREGQGHDLQDRPAARRH